MNIIKLLIALIALNFYITSSRAQIYSHLGTGSKIEGQQFYILPQTAFIIEIPILKTELSRDSIYIPYTYSQLKILNRNYGVDISKYLSLKDKFKDTSYKILEDSIKVNTIGVPDYNKIYFLDSKSKWNKNQSVTFSYSLDGIINEGSSSYEDKTFDIVVKGISSLATVAGSFFKGSTKGGSPALEVKRDTATIIEELEDIKKEYIKLYSQNNYDIYKSLKTALEKKYSDVFGEVFYKEKQKITIIKIMYTPTHDKNISTPIPLLYFDNTIGKIKFNTDIKDQISGKNIFFDILPSDSYKFQFKESDKNLTNYFNSRPDESTGFAFNIPIKYEVSLLNPKSDHVYNEIIKISQFGTVGYTNTKNETLTFVLDPNTGELKKLTIDGKAILVDQVSNTSSSLIEVINLFKDEDPDTVLQKEVIRLENEKKKRDLLNELYPNN